LYTLPTLAGPDEKPDVFGMDCRTVIGPHNATSRWRVLRQVEIEVGPTKAVHGSGSSDGGRLSVGARVGV